MKAILILVLAISFIGNISVCFLVARHYRFRNVTNGYIVNMAVTHLCFAVFCIPLKLQLSEDKIEEELITIFHFNFVLFTTSSSFSVCLITLDRLNVMQSSGRNKVSAKTAKRTVFASWTLSLLLATVLVVLLRHLKLQTCKYSNGKSFMVCRPLLFFACNETSRITNAVYVTLSFLLPSSFSILAFAKIWKRMWSGCSHIRPLGGGHHGLIYFTAEIRTTRTIFVVFLLFHICCGPYFIASLYNTHNYANRSQNSFFYNILVCLAFGNCCVCPLVYAIRNPRVSFKLSRKKQLQKLTLFHVGLSSETEKSKGKAYCISWAQERNCVSLFDQSDPETATTSVS